VGLIWVKNKYGTRSNYIAPLLDAGCPWLGIKIAAIYLLSSAAPTPAVQMFAKTCAEGCSYYGRAVNASMSQSQTRILYPPY
jgi:hypothetical protein